MTLLVKQMTKVNSSEQIDPPAQTCVVMSQGKLGQHHDRGALQASMAKHRSLTGINGITEEPYRHQKP